MANRIGSRKYRPNLKGFYGRPDLTPLIDVLFLLLIFFMLSSSFVQISGIKVDLPKVDTAAKADIAKFIVSISGTENGALLYFNDMPVTYETLAEKLSGIGAGAVTDAIVIRADRNTSIETFARVAAIAEKAGLAAFVAVVPEAPGGATKSQVVLEKEK